jgi:glucokinase
MVSEHSDVKSSPRPLEGAVLAIDLGATWTRAAVVTKGGHIVARGRARTPVDGRHEDLAAAILSVAERAVTAPAAEGVELAAAGVASVGPLDSRSGVLAAPPNLGPGYRGLDVATPLGVRFGVPVYVERDTNVAALAERAFGAAKGVDDFVYLTVSTGLGGGVVTAGRLLTGASGVAGELGHVPVALDGAVCGCGGVGHLEAFCSGAAIARAGREAGITAPSATGASDSEVTRDNEGGETAAVTAADVAAAERAGDARATAIMGLARQAFATAMVGIVNAFNPRLIVVGGGVARGEGERLLGPAREAVAATALPPAAAVVELVPAALGDDVSLMGCVPLITAGEMSWRP